MRIIYLPNCRLCTKTTKKLCYQTRKGLWNFFKILSSQHYPCSLPFFQKYYKYPIYSPSFHHLLSVTTLTLGSWPKQGGYKVAGQEGGLVVASHALGSANSAQSVREWTLTLPSELPLWELKSKWISKSLERNCKDKTHWFVKIFISLERYWNLNV